MVSVSSYDQGDLHVTFVYGRGFRFYDSYTGGMGQKTLLYLTFLGSPRGFGRLRR